MGDKQQCQRKTNSCSQAKGPVSYRDNHGEKHGGDYLNPGVEAVEKGVSAGKVVDVQFIIPILVC